MLILLDLLILTKMLIHKVENDCREKNIYYEHKYA